MRDILVVLSWWLLIQLLGLAAWPLAFRLLRFLPDRGYTAAKPLGLLLVCYALWLLGSLGLVTNSIGGILFALILLIAASVWALSRDGIAALRDWLSRHRAMVLIYEVLFAVAMFGFAAWRATNSAINSTEKPMEFMFLNSILRSPSFPPHDAWLSGFGISYYYFGYVMMAMMTRLAGTLHGVAYNVSSALWFALIAGGSFGAAYDIAQASPQSPSDLRPPAYGPRKTAIAIGVTAAIFVTFLGNLEGTLELAHQSGVGSPEFWQWLDIKDISGPAETGSITQPLRYYWWWRASRVVHDYTPQGSDQEVIDEFPFFSFVNGDLHPHTLAYPFVFLAISLALNVYCSETRFLKENGFLKRLALPWPDLLLYAVCLGALGFLNTWDFPIYLFLVVAAFALRRWQETRRLDEPQPRHSERSEESQTEGSRSREVETLRSTRGDTSRDWGLDKVITDAIVLGAILGIAGFALYLPFYVSFQSQARGILPNLFNATRFPQFLVMFGQFAVPGALFLLVLAALRSQVSAWRFWLGTLGWAVVLLLAAALVELLMGLISPDGRTALNAWRTGNPIPGLDSNTSMDVRGALFKRLFDPWTALLLALALVVMVKLTIQQFGKTAHQYDGESAASEEIEEEAKEAEPLDQPALPFVLLLFFLGAVLAFSVEFVYLADSFGTRMNTVFKFYYQTWALWGVAAAYAVGWMLADSSLWAPFRVVTGTITALLVAAGLAYPIVAISTLGDRAHPTLDGTAWVAQQSPDDYAAIQWLNQNIAEAPVVLEAPGQSYHSELSRVSAFTGLPTVLGWPGHELQWRGDFVEAGRREPDIKLIYTTREAQEALTLMDKYAISYVYVGPAERAMFPAYGLNKFDAMMDVVFQHGNVTIYRRK